MRFWPFLPVAMRVKICRLRGANGGSDDFFIGGGKVRCVFSAGRKTTKASRCVASYKMCCYKTTKKSEVNVVVQVMIIVVKIHLHTKHFKKCLFMFLVKIAHSLFLTN